MYIRCKICKGMFSDELCVTVSDTSVFVDKKFVDIDNSSIKVTLSEDGKFVILPDSYHESIPLSMVTFI